MKSPDLASKMATYYSRVYQQLSRGALWVQCEQRAIYAHAYHHAAPSFGGIESNCLVFGPEEVFDHRITRTKFEIFFQFVSRLLANSSMCDEPFKVLLLFSGEF